MIQLQDPRTIGLDGTTRDLLSQVTKAVDEVNTLRPFSTEVQGRIHKSLLPDRIVASLNMEGITATRRQTLDVMDAMRINESIGRGKQEIFNALKADEFIFECVNDGIPLDENLIRQINRHILENVHAEAGQFRLGSIQLPGAPFPPPESGDVPILIKALCEHFTQAEPLHPVVQAAWLHGQFTLIHPFRDGNGRTGRMLQDYVLLRRGMLPIGIPPSHRDDYYNALASADKGDWNDLVEMLALLELSMTTKVIVLAKEPEKRAAWIEKLSEIASKKQENTRHKIYLVWRQRIEHVSRAFIQAVQELDESSDNIGAEIREFSVPEFSEWKRICDIGYTERNWLFSIMFFCESKPFYKSIAFLQRHHNIAVDTFAGERDLVGIYFTGIQAHSYDRPPYSNYRDPHIRLREILYRGDEQIQYIQESPNEAWSRVDFTGVEEIVESFFMDVFIRKAGLAT